ncbi:Aste57867_3616 [Globisporangium polare]
MVELWCAVVNDGSVFPITIDAHACVQELQQAIARQQACKCVASKLKLHVAKRSAGAWLQDDDRDVKQLMSSGRCPKGLSALMRRETVMLPTRTISDAIAKAELPEPSKQEIHVLVQLPEPVTALVSVPAQQERQVPDTSSHTTKLLQQVLHELAALRKELGDKMDELVVEHKKREVVAFADMSAGQHTLLTKKLQLAVKPLKVSEQKVNAAAAASGSSTSGSPASIPPFQWTKTLNKKKHAEAYHAYVETHMKETLEACDLALVCVEANKTLLSVDDERLPFALKGGTELLVLTNFGDDTEDMALLFPGLRLAIHIERDVAQNLDARYSQAVAKLIAVDLKTTGGQSAMLLLSDLQHTWVFLWLDSEPCIRSVALSEPTNAFAFLKSVITKWDQFGGRFVVPFAAAESSTKSASKKSSSSDNNGKRPYKRQKISDMRPAVDDDDEDE